MKVLLINTYFNKGGAAIACYRLLKALQKAGCEAKMLVQQPNPNDELVHSISNNFIKMKLQFLYFLWERLIFYFYEKSKEIRFTFSLANVGNDISKHPLVKEADILHLHWINQGFLSLKGINSLLRLKKPIVITMHDMWYFTGGCHYSGNCQHYKQKCGNCAFIYNPTDKDISFNIFNKKLSLYENQELHIVTCSAWLGELAKQATLLKNSRIVNIPNPIDVAIYKECENVEQTREQWKLPVDKHLLLFGAANLNDKRKGLKYLLEAIEIFVRNYSSLAANTELVVFGKSKDFPTKIAGLKVYNLSVIYEQQKIASLYGCVSAFILPSLEDNLPNTVMESLACGTPVVAFNFGGVPEMIEHLANGYLAEYKSAADLAKGIAYVLDTSTHQNLRKKARNKVLMEFTEEIVAKKYLQLYQSILAKKYE